MPPIGQVVLRYIREHALMRAGERVGVAVSGGADSVALLRILLELRGELGVVLAVVHLNHGLRGVESDSDANFVSVLAREHGLEFFSKKEDTDAYAAQRKIGIEAAGRELRYYFFDELAHKARLSRVATAHTLDDQAETVLLRLLRGAWTQGLAGIYPEVQRAFIAVVRPLLSTRRADLRAYLSSLGQTWREDVTNNDVSFLRNRVRHELLPQLERDFNPAIAQRLADTAELARAEQEYWEQHAQRYCDQLTRDPARIGSVAPLSISFDFELFTKLPVAVQRHILHSRFSTPASPLDFHHIEQLRQALLAPDRLAREVELPGGYLVRFGQRELWIELRCPTSKGQAAPTDQHPIYEHQLPIPGAVYVPELGARFNAVSITAPNSGVQDGTLIRVDAVGSSVTLRNWRPGDRFWPAHTRAPEKVKRLLTERHITGPERERWPVLESAGKLLWMRDFPVAADAVAKPGEPAVLIVESAAASAQETET